MSEIRDKFQLWGTFSVMDHLRSHAFLPEVIMYDKLVIPIPPDPEHTKTAEERNYAVKQWDRWKKNGWNPERQQKLLGIIKPVTVQIEWNLERHQQWATLYEQSKRDAAQQFSEILAGWKTGEVLLNELPAMAGGVVAVSPYESLDDLKKDFGITEKSSIEDQLQAGRGLPNLISAVIGREFLVPEEPDRDEFYLLQKAVDVVQEVDYKRAREDFHNAQLQFLNNGKTDLLSVTKAVEAMADHLDVLRKFTRWNGIRRAFFFAQMVFDVLTAPINPVSAGKASIALGKFTVDERLKNPADQYSVRPAAALLLDSRRRLNLTLGP